VQRSPATVAGAAGTGVDTPYTQVAFTTSRLFMVRGSIIVMGDSL
jgi:hypothetical protein